MNAHSRRALQENLGIMKARIAQLQINTFFVFWAGWSPDDKHAVLQLYKEAPTVGDQKACKTSIAVAYVEHAKYSFGFQGSFRADRAPLRSLRKRPAAHSSVSINGKCICILELLRTVQFHVKTTSSMSIPAQFRCRPKF
eukprot:scaffold227158_cov19-Tisochrysis_lutea.AAC.1